MAEKDKKKKKTHKSAVAAPSTTTTADDDECGALNADGPRSVKFVDTDGHEAPDGSGSRTTLDIVNEIMGSVAEPPAADQPYDAPVAVVAGDINALQDLDERKLIELKEAFMIFDLDGDGCIDAADLHATFGTLGDDNVPDGLVEQMLSEAMSPLDFDSFVMLMGYKTIEMDPEDVLVEALGKWDLQKRGVIDEEKLRHDLMCYGDRLTEAEVDYALEEAPITNKNRAPDETPLIDYASFGRNLAGFRKRKQSSK